MLAYASGETLVHRLDPRTKLGVQVAFVAAAFVHTTPLGLLVLTVLVLGVLGAAGLRPRTAFREVRVVVPFLAAGPIIEAARFGSPWLDLGDAVAPALASYRTLLLLALALTYVRTTPVRHSEAAVAWAIPGRVGRLAALGVGLVFRFLPLLQADVARAREASSARLGTERPLRDRVRLVAAAGLGRALGRADRLAVAMRARCLSWDPTRPDLRPGRADLVGGALAAALVGWAFAPGLVGLLSAP
ncbi:energy-coupling factor transporter transmembrane protein EcfT [Halorarum halophilum]|uniref:Energy-coupling factor transporter transmembrane protein EcfT n=1 Tax=Halorarum halophilum TaxID=2743090 RepID=A0A7D5K6K2_9EURY|nr:energy-coupling factor transporter transmembrane protein EcfT [Halobaculum halophilum]QLG26794.1 energy-coupling factor transporter transmembrane protein EcfT [Halobaculum halophilum]